MAPALEHTGPGGAEVVLSCADLEATVAFFERLGFRVLTVFPADAPRTVVVAAQGLRLRLERGGDGSPAALRLLCRGPEALAAGESTLVAPNGTRVELVRSPEPSPLPPLRSSFVLSRLAEGSPWHTGRAGMAYRDLVPDRQGGRFIASHIRIANGGPVPDYVHYHEVRFQMIYCVRGWVRVVYEDQGPPFVMRAGDCVLQPPNIRHRVLECSPGLEVVEVSSPAEHYTHADLELELPTAAVLPERDFGGQRFTRHAAEAGACSPSRYAGFEARDLGLGAATSGLATAKVLRAATGHGGGTEAGDVHDAELRFGFVAAGHLELRLEGEAPVTLGGGDAFVIPAGRSFTLAAPSSDVEVLEVVVGAAAAA